MCGASCMIRKEVHLAASLIMTDELRFGHEVVQSVRCRGSSSSWEVARDRVLSEREYTSERLWRLIAKPTQLQRYQRGVHGPDRLWENLEVLLLAREAHVTQQKDKVYGILGLKTVADMVDTRPHYALATSFIYISFSRDMLSRGNLDLLRLASRPVGGVNVSWSIDDIPPALNRPYVSDILGPILRRMKGVERCRFVVDSCEHGLPSWTVCWICQCPPIRQLMAPYRSGGTLPPPPPIFSDLYLTCTLKGIAVDTITSLSFFHVSEADSRYPLNTTGTSSSLNAYRDLEATRTALWRTLVGNSTHEGHIPAPEFDRWILTRKLWRNSVPGVYTNGFGLHDFMSRNRRLLLCGYTFEEIVHERSLPWYHPPRRLNYVHTNGQLEALTRAVNVMAWRRLVGTERGRMELATAAAVTGDTVAVLVGCSTPTLLRKERDGWQVVGECYLHGCMHGEAIDANDRDGGEVMDIKLY